MRFSILKPGQSKANQTVSHSKSSMTLIFESLILKLQLKILIYLFLKRIAIYSGTICDFVLYFPSLLLSYFHNFKNKRESVVY